MEHPLAPEETTHTTNFKKLTSEASKGELASIVYLIDTLLEEAQNRSASDIHIDPTSRELRVRLRIDGVLIDLITFSKHIHPEIISRIKVLSGLRTDEHQTPQDGRFRHILMEEQPVDVRVSIAPTYHGENVVLRILTNPEANMHLESLGFSRADRVKIEAALRTPSGMILATGPTGSGKTTTLYTLIKKLNAPSISIVTIEDPIEYSIENIEQIQVNPRTGLTFATGLRSILRQDPDIIMVGEIRDGETASIAVNTALTGHLLLSTLHTNDAATTLPRLSDMGIDPYLVASTITLAIGQRLVRKICGECKEENAVSKTEEQSLAHLKLSTPITEGECVSRGRGCRTCASSGYCGRISINEVLVASPVVKDAILRKASSREIRSLAVSEGMTTMLEDGFTKVRSGVTTVEEILRVIHE